MNTMYSITIKNQVTLPKEVRDTLKVGSKQHVHFVEEGGRVYIEKAVSIADVQTSNQKILEKKKLLPATDEELSKARSKFYAEDQSW